MSFVEGLKEALLMTAVVNGMTPRRFSDMRYKSGKLKLDKRTTKIRRLLKSDIFHFESSPWP